MMVWIAWEPPLYTYSASHSRWTRNQRATSMIFGRSMQNTWMKKGKPQKQGLTGLDFEKNVKNCQKMNKNAKNRENWSFAMSCSSKTSMVRGGFFYIISKIMHERTTTESLVTIARWFFSNYKVALHLKLLFFSSRGTNLTIALKRFRCSILFLAGGHIRLCQIFLPNRQAALKRTRVEWNF